jgi:glycosyltransferase involved in cell wall biosynthesis
MDNLASSITQESLEKTVSSLVHNGVDYHCFLAPTGYTQAAIDNIKSLESAGINVFLKCVHGRMIGTGFSKEEIFWLTNLLNKNSLSNSIQILHAIPPRWKNIKLKKDKVALFVFENPSIPSLWLEDLKKCKSVVVPSKFNYDSLVSCGLNNVHLVHHAVDTSIWNYETVTPRSDSAECIKIITIGTWRERKNWKNMFMAILSLIQSHPHVSWTLKVDKSGNAISDVKKWLNEYGKISLFGKNIIVDGRILDEYSMARLVCGHDILLSASYGEGFGLPALQACMAGLAVVCPNYGGYCEFFNKNCYVEVKSKGFAKRLGKMDGLPQFDNLVWPVYDKDSVLDALYLCIGNLPNIKESARKISNEYSIKFNNKNIGKSFLNVLKM